MWLGAFPCARSAGRRDGDARPSSIEMSRLGLAALRPASLRLDTQFVFSCLRGAGVFCATLKDGKGRPSICLRIFA